MDLRARLERVAALHKASARVDAEPQTTDDPPLDALVGGTWAVRDGMRCLVVEEPYADTFRHGGVALRDALELPGEVWRPYAAAPDGRSFDMRDALFVDIETTGLARGAGTYAFLIGIGAFEGECFVVRQFFMPGYAEEDALLSLVGDAMERGGGLVTFNGRSFDWPIIESRYVLARRCPPCSEVAHLDLLHLARRLWRRSLRSCALSSLEAHVLGVERHSNDVPGYLIPQLYQDYLHAGRTRPMADVFYHNLVDILSLVSLAGLAGRLINEPFRAPDEGICDYYALGVLLESEGRAGDAIRAYRVAAFDGGRRTAEATKRLSYLYKRLGRYEEAMEVWRSACGGGELYPYVELAKQYEHRLKDYGRAREVVMRALEWLGSPQCALGRYEARRARSELEHRLARLERRLEASA